MNWNFQSFKLGMKLILPILPSVIIFGLIFGITGYTTGLSLPIVSSMSYIIFAGSSQFLVLILIQDQDPLAAILLAGILINLRHIFYGASLHYDLKNTGRKKILAAYLLTDEAYLICNFAKKSKDIDQSQLKVVDVVISGGGLLWISWNISTILGYLIGASTNYFDKIPSNFIVAGTFLGYLILQWEQSPKERKFMLSIILISFTLSFFLNGVYLLFITLLVGMIIAQQLFPLYELKEPNLEAGS